MNLHAIVRTAITAVHPDEPLTLYQSTGQVIGNDGTVTPSYASGVQVQAQVQTEGDATLYHADRVGMNEITRKMYLLTDSALATQVAGVIREIGRNGDMIQRADGTWWLVTSRAGKFCRRQLGVRPLHHAGRAAGFFRVAMV